MGWAISFRNKWPTMLKITRMPLLVQRNAVRFVAALHSDGQTRFWMKTGSWFAACDFVIICECFFLFNIRTCVDIYIRVRCACVCMISRNCRNSGRRQRKLCWTSIRRPCRWHQCFNIRQRICGPDVIMLCFSEIGAFLVFQWILFVCSLLLFMDLRRLTRYRNWQGWTESTTVNQLKYANRTTQRQTQTRSNTSVGCYQQIDEQVWAFA